MGAQRALQWAASYPDYLDHIVATGPAKTYGHGLVRLESEIMALTTDPAFMNGDYKTEPVNGIKAFSIVWTAWLLLQERWRQELCALRNQSPPETNLGAMPLPYIAGGRSLCR
jgi:homoserine O-acetyltransferase/O-succinyltransferase